MRINVSEILLQQECPLKRALRYDGKKRKKSEFAGAFSRGSAFHKAAEMFLLGKGGDWKEASTWYGYMQHYIISTWDGATVNTKTFNTVLQQCEWLSHWASEMVKSEFFEDFEILGVEVEGEFSLGLPMNRNRVFGMIDAVVRRRDDNAIFALQWKTWTYGTAAEPTKGLADKITRVKTSMHEATYRKITEGLIKKHKWEGWYAGTLLMVLRVITPNKKQGGKRDVSEAWNAHELCITEEWMERNLNLVGTAIDTNKEVKLVTASTPIDEWRDRIAFHEGSCLSFTGARCGFWDFCKNGVSMESGEFEDYDPLGHYDKKKGEKGRGKEGQI